MNIKILKFKNKIFMLWIHFQIMIYGKSKIGKGTFIGENVLIGYPTAKELKYEKEKIQGAIIGDNCILRDFGVIYSKAFLGNNIRTGHYYLVREETVIGDNTLIGTAVIIDNKCKIGKNVSLQSGVYIPTNTIIEDKVFIGPNAVLTNDKYPVRIKKELIGPRIKKFASIGANSTILPEITIGEGAMIGANSVITKDVPDWSLAIGAPAKFKKLRKELIVENKL